jgi:hypothetical protein
MHCNLTSRVDWQSNELTHGGPCSVVAFTTAVGAEKIQVFFVLPTLCMLNIANILPEVWGRLTNKQTPSRSTVLEISRRVSSRLAGDAAAVVSTDADVKDFMVSIWSASGDCLYFQAAQKSAVSLFSDDTKSEHATFRKNTNASVVLMLGADGVIYLKRFKCTSEAASPVQVLR